MWTKTLKLTLAVTLVVVLCEQAFAQAHRRTPAPAPRVRRPPTVVRPRVRAERLRFERVTHLIRRLRTGAYFVRLNAAAQLGHIGGPRALVALSHASAVDRHPKVRQAALKALGTMGRQGVPAAIRALLSDPNLRKCAAQTLGCVGDLRSVVPLRHAARYDVDFRVRWAAATALRRIVAKGFAVWPTPQIPGPPPHAFPRRGR